MGAVSSVHVLHRSNSAAALFGPRGTCGRALLLLCLWLTDGACAWQQHCRSKVAGEAAVHTVLHSLVAFTVKARSYQNNARVRIGQQSAESFTHGSAVGRLLLCQTRQAEHMLGTIPTSYLTNPAVPAACRRLPTQYQFYPSSLFPAGVSSRHILPPLLTGASLPVALRRGCLRRNQGEPVALRGRSTGGASL